ncbi:MAG: DUF3880 domain-containing protein [Desulfovibrio sp.]
MNTRPQRIQISSEIGQLQTLASGVSQFELLRQENSGPIFFLGLGPIPLDTVEIANHFPTDRKIFYVESPHFLHAMPKGYVENIPSHFQSISPEEFAKSSQQPCTIFRYRQGMRLFPSFWSTPYAQALIPHPQKSTEVWIPTDGKDLLSGDILHGFENNNCNVKRVQYNSIGELKQLLLTTSAPDIFFSINGRGFDTYGEIASMLHHAGTRTAMWFVDNPFNILSGFKAPFWKKTLLLCTDDWFIPALKDLGATTASHLPLAAAPHFFTPAPKNNEYSSLRDRIVFVGHSEFPAKKGFFAGCSTPDNFEQTALANFAQGTKANFSDFLQPEMPLWPGKALRAPAYLAEETGRLWRTHCLNQTPENLTIFGDAGWKDHLPNISDIRPEVDYFTQLPAIYANAGINLNMTSPLLPNGLTQRHFDVWAAGGVLLTDYSRGLDIFPKELREQIYFTNPSEIPTKIQKISAPIYLEQLKIQWFEHIQKHHTYPQRTAAVLNFL